MDWAGKQPFVMHHVGGREFSVYREYDEERKESYAVYPDFEETPAYTDEGRPFATAVQECCPHAVSKKPGAALSGDCGGCDWFRREETPHDIIGICMCDTLRKVTK